MSEGTCDVSIGGYDGDGPEFFHVATVTARKPHKCDECGGALQPGQRYERSSGKWEGDWSTHRSCLQCGEITAEFGEDYAFGQFWPEMESAWAHGAHLQACLNRLKTVPAKERMRQQWMKWKGLV
jgi:hypothetical protein